MDLKNFRRRAARNKEQLTGFLRKFDELVTEDLHDVVARIDAQVWQETDCLQCANCCKTMTPTYTPEDIKRISAHLNMKPAEFREKWLHQDADNGDWVNVSVPCQFLGADNKCSIYEVRPADCAEFPHHNKKPFDDYNDTFIGNVSRCPATYELVQRLRKAILREYNWSE